LSTIQTHAKYHKCAQKRKKTLKKLVRFIVLTVAGMKITAFWDIALCSLLEANRRFRGAYCPHDQEGNHHPGD
jgi:hypothetical protein